MRRAWVGLLVGVLVVALLAACGRTKEDLVQMSRGVGTRAELERALGKPSDTQWTYKASNGTVVFLIVGDKVTLQATGSPDDKKDQK